MDCNMPDITARQIERSSFSKPKGAPHISIPQSWRFAWKASSGIHEVRAATHNGSNGFFSPFKITKWKVSFTSNVPFSPLCKSLWKMISLNKPNVFVPQLFQFSLFKQIKTLWKWITHMWLYNSQVHPRCSVAEILLLVTDWGLTRFLPIANNSVKCYLRRGEAHNGFLRYSARNHSFPHPWAPPIITVSDSGSAATSDKLFLDRYHTSG